MDLLSPVNLHHLKVMKIVMMMMLNLRSEVSLQSSDPNVLCSAFGMRVHLKTEEYCWRLTYMRLNPAGTKKVLGLKEHHFPHPTHRLRRDVEASGNADN